MSFVKTAAAIVGCAAVLVRADVITFDDLAHGEIVDNQYSASNGLTISAVNVGGGPDLAAAFNTDLSGTADPDLEGPPWETGNLPLDTEFGNALIIAENDWGSGDGILDSPDDEGSRPAGTLVFDFDRSISEFGFDLLDVEGPEEYGPHSGYVMTFYSEDATRASIGFGNFISRDGAAYGDNSINRIAPIGAADVGLSEFDYVEVNFGGSGAIDNITYTRVPEPATSALLGMGLLCLVGLVGGKRKID